MPPPSKLALTPIPPLPPVHGWKSTPIVECGEPLVLLSGATLDRVHLAPQYVAHGIPGASMAIYVREGVATRLAHAAGLLPPSLYLLIWDGWRPLQVQQSLFDQQLAVVQNQFPSANDAECIRRTETYVSLPSSHADRPSPHYTGGAVDLTLARAESQPVPMGTDFDAFDLRAQTRSLEDRVERGERLTREEAGWLRNRRVLYHAMVAAGFSAYPEEWWHFDYGNQFWATAHGVAAVYGGVEPRSAEWS